MVSISRGDLVRSGQGGVVARTARDRDSEVLAAVAEQLRVEAARRRVTIRELARRSALPYPSVQKSLAGTRMIDVVELAKLCVALDVTPADLLRHIDLPGADRAEERQTGSEA
jgi:DNA-binding Xre family transcriptional regulator